MNRRRRAYPSLERYLQVNGLLQTDLARALGICDGHLSNIMSGKRPCSVELLFRLSAHTGVPLETIRGLYAGRESYKLGRTA
jgi:plasmid maintenance system antidote protein VapI